MQSFGDFTPIDALAKEFLRSLRSATHIFQPNYEKDPKYIMKSTEEHLLHFSNQIVIVEEIKMAHVEDGYIPRKLNQWLNKATDLKSQVIDALKKQQNRNDNDNDDPSLQYNELKHMCDEILDKMKDFPIEDVNDKPIDFIAPLHETADIPSDDGVRFQDHVDKEVSSSSCDDKKGKRSSITSRSLSGIVSFLESYGKPRLQGFMGESSNISMVQYEEQREASSLPYSKDSIPIPRDSTRGGESELGMMVHMLLTGKMSKYVDLRVEILSTSSSQETISLNNVFGLRHEMDKYSFWAMRKAVELEVETSREILSTSSSQEKIYLNNVIGLRHEMDQYSSAMRKAVELEVDTSGEKAALLPENLIVNRSVSEKEMPTDEEWNEAGVVNLMEKNVRSLSGTPDCPNLVILFLQRNSRLTDIPSLFFDQMPALCFLDLSDTRIKDLPTSLFELTNLQVLLLRSCACLDRLPPEVKNLRNLEILDLLETDLSDLPKEIGELTKLRHLQLSFYQHDSQSMAAIFELQALQGLSIVVDPNDEQWVNIVGDIIKEVGELKMLSYLQFYFPSVEALRYFSEVNLSWNEQRLRSFKFLVGKNVKRIISRVPDEVESKYEKYDTCLKFVNGNEVPEVMRTMLKPVTAFYLDHHLEIRSLTEFDVSNFKELKFCVLRECPNIQVMINAEERMGSDFPNLEYLGLYYLWKLEKIWEDPILPPGSYEALKYLMVSTCGKLEHIASADVLQSLYNLETLIIEDCESLKTIVEENEMIKYDGPFLLPRLKELVLRHLPQLVALGRGFFPSEDTTSIVHFCPKFILTARSRTSRIEWKKFLGLSNA